MSEKTGKKATQYKNEYNKNAYDNLRIVVPKGRKKDIEAYAREKGVSVNGLVNDLLRECMSIEDEEWKTSRQKECGKPGE